MVGRLSLAAPTNSEQAIHMHYILSKNKVTSLILQPAKVDKDGNTIQEPIRIEFEGLIFATDSDDVLERFKKLKNWGTEYSLVDKNPNEIVMPSPNISVSGMNNPAEEKDSRLSNLESKVDTIASAVNQMAEFMKSLTKEKKKDKEKDKEEDKSEKEPEAK